MKITILCSDPQHPINSYIQRWVEAQVGMHEIDIVQKKSQLRGGDILFLISCSEIINASDRAQYDACLVLHASDLPKGRGWSPHIWALVQGAEMITLSMLEAEDKVDSGRIWHKMHISVPKHALWDEVNHLLFTAEVDMIQYAIQNYALVTPQDHMETDQATYYSKRTPQDSRIDPYKSIQEQFDLIRVCDPNRFPAYFEYLGQRYILKLEKSNEK
ncbi:formyltransferase family protein [Polynucleobacter acidiphobus]|uniref:formyltransferase family protein n=1 Tax=Polynucleobacter acidiphobus TaxID=556053 RepID=UPI000D3A5192|nr:formyltransferase family protein [Polynucleobacter acidiphobus]